MQQSKFLILFFSLFFIQTSFAQILTVYSGDQETTIVKGKGTANGGTYYYEATIKSKFEVKILGEFWVYLSIPEYKITGFNYNGEDAAYFVDASFPISPKGYFQSDISGDYRIKEGSSYYITGNSFTERGIGRSADLISFIDIDGESKKTLKQHLNGDKSKLSNINVYLFNLSLKNDYFEELSAIKSLMDKKFKANGNIEKIKSQINTLDSNNKDDIVKEIALYEQLQELDKENNSQYSTRISTLKNRLQDLKQKETHTTKTSKSSTGLTLKKEKDAEDEKQKNKEENNTSNSSASKASMYKGPCYYLEQYRAQLRTAQYQGQIDNLKRQITKLEGECNQARANAFPMSYSDRSYQRDLTKQQQAQEYQMRMLQQKKQNQQIATAMGASSIGFLFVLGGAIYSGAGRANPNKIYTGNNLYQGLELGYTGTGTPILFNSKINKTEVTKEEYAIQINLKLKYKLGYETQQIYLGKFGLSLGGYGYIAGEAGFSPLFDAFSYNYNYGGRLFFGHKNVKLFGEYSTGQKVFTVDDWMDEEEFGSGKTDYNFEQYKYGFMFSWYGNETTAARNHIAIGWIEHRFLQLGNQVIIKPLSDPKENKPNFFDDAFSGFFFEWKHDHHGILSIEAFGNFPYTGLKTSNYDRDSEFKNATFINIGYVRSFDWW